MKKRRFWQFALFVMLMVISVASVLTGCGGKAKAVTLVDFDDKTVTVEYGAIVEVENNAVYDTEGNVYPVKATVTDADDREIMLVNGAFLVKDMRGYKIVYTVADTSVSAKKKTVTVTVNNDGTPAVYFTDKIINVWSGDEITVPDYSYTVGPGYTIISNTLELYRIQGENRVKVDSFNASAEKFTITDAGDYVFAATVATKEKSATAELVFEVKSESQRYAIAACESAWNINLGIDYYESGAYLEKEKPVIAYSAQMKRNDFVSKGSVSVSVKSGYGDVGIFVTPEINGNEFVQKLSNPDAMISLWVKVCGVAEKYGVFSNIDPDMPKSVSKTVPANTWTNILLNPNRENLLSLYNNLCTGTTLFTVESGDGGDVTIYVDSIYVAEPINANGTFAEVTANTNEAFTIRAESTNGGRFYYTVEGADEENETGTFTSPVVGAIFATAYPVQNRYYGALTTIVTLNGGEYTFTLGEKEHKFTSGTHDLITVTTNYDGSVQITYSLMKADGSECYSKVNGNKMRLFEGEHLLSASMKVNDIQYRAITKLSVSPASVYDEATIEDFDNSYSLGNIAQTVSWNHMPLTYVGDYEGRTGVMKFDLTNLKDNPGFIIRQPIGSANWSEAFDENDYIAFDLKVEGTIPEGAAICWRTPTDKTQWVVFENTNEWQTLYIPLNSLDFLTSEQVKVFFGGAPEGGNFGIAVYIDRIYAATHESRVKHVTLVNFEDETKEATLNDTITVTHADAQDTEGNTYRVKATVTDPDGEVVTVSDGKFMAQKTGTYTIVYEIDEPFVASDPKTVRITVKDPKDDWGYTFAFAKEEQELASGTHDLIAVTTNYDGSEQITYSLMKADGSECYSKVNGNKMRLFEGEHLLVASITVNNIRYTAATTIRVTPAPVTDNATIEDFDNPSSLDNTAQSVSWNPIPLTFVGDYSGRTGVMKFDLTNLKDNPGFSIERALGNANWSETYDGNDYIAFDLKVEGTIPEGVAICWNPPTGGTQWVNFENTNEWQTLYIPLSSFDFLTSKQVKVFFGGAPEGVNFGIAVYIDRIYASARPATAENTIEDFDHPVSMSNLAVHEMPVEYLDSFEGKTGILKLDLTTETAEYPKFQTGAPIGTVNNNNFTKGYIAIDMYVEGTIPEGASIGNVYDNKLYYQDGALVNGWHTYYLSLEKLQFLSYNVVEACFAKSNEGAFGIAVYIDRIYASARPATAANTIEDFDHPVSMSNLAVHEMPVEYLDSFEGKTGILKLDLTAEKAEYPKFQIGAPIGTVNKNNFKEGYIAIDMYVEGTIPEGAIIGNVYENELYWQDGALVNGWHTYYLSLGKLQFLNYNVVEACFAKSNAGAFGIKVYIDRIYTVTQAEKDAATNP